MTRKDFEAIATAIRGAAPRKPAIGGGNLAATTLQAGAKAALHEVAHAIADVLENSNPNFDHARFLKACGID